MACRAELISALLTRAPPLIHHWSIDRSVFDPAWSWSAGSGSPRTVAARKPNPNQTAHALARAGSTRRQSRPARTPSAGHGPSPAAASPVTGKTVGEQEWYPMPVSPSGWLHQLTSAPDAAMITAPAGRSGDERGDGPDAPGPRPGSVRGVDVFRVSLVLRAAWLLTRAWSRGCVDGAGLEPAGLDDLEACGLDERQLAAGEVLAGEPDGDAFGEPLHGVHGAARCCRHGRAAGGGHPGAGHAASRRGLRPGRGWCTATARRPPCRRRRLRRAGARRRPRAARPHTREWRRVRERGPASRG